MSDPLPRLRRFLRELKRRKVYRAAAGYLVAAFVVLQLAGLAADAFGFPAWFEPMVWVLAGLGFPIVLVVAWAFEMTPEGVQRTTETEEGAAPPTGGGASGWIAALVVLLLAGGGFWYLTAGGGEKPSAETVAATDTAGTAATRLDTAGPPRIAVLPFENIAPDSAGDYFVQGMHEEVLHQLSKVSGLEVISRTSVMRYADTDKPVSVISDELGGVNALLEGTVRRAGDRVRITTQLIKTPEDAHLWSNTYDRQLSVEQIFDIQANIAEQIAGSLETQLAEGERRRIENAPTDDLGAYDAYLQGRSHLFETMATRQAADIRRSVKYLREAVRRDSSFAEANAWLGLAYNWRSSLEGGNRWMDSASAAVGRARAIEPNLAAAYLAQGWIYRTQDSTAARITALRRALELQPSHGFAKSELSDALRADGQYVEAIRVAREAVQLAPRQPRVLTEMGDQLRAVGFYEAAAAWDRRALEIEPGHFDAIMGLGGSHAQRGRFKQALATLQDYLKGTDALIPLALFLAGRGALAGGQPEQAKAYLERIPEARRQQRPEQAEPPSELTPFGPAERAHLGLAELRLGNRERGRKLLQQAADSLRAELAKQEASADTALGFFRGQITLAEALAGLGQREQALDRLEASETAIRRVTGQVLASPFFDDEFRSHPRFQKIVREVKARRAKLREEVRQLGIDLYPPGAGPDTASRAR